MLKMYDILCLNRYIKHPKAEVYIHYIHYICKQKERQPSDENLSWQYSLANLNIWSCLQLAYFIATFLHFFCKMS